MKKFICIFTILIIAFGVYATSKGAYIYLSAPDNTVKIGFADSVANATAGVSTSSINLGKFALTDDLELAATDYSGKVFIFYKGVVNSSSNYSLTLTINRPFQYWDDSAYQDYFIGYSAIVKDPSSDNGGSQSLWDGSNASNITTGITIASSTDTPQQLETQLRKSGVTNFVAKGIAQIKISIPKTDISTLRYGNYRTEMTLTLTTT
ncbi:MAG: hypothetical protein MSS69_00710 [Spirochaetales bacterium]|nr:hypothetical protein [Spirochaetales bacterium]